MKVNHLSLSNNWPGPSIVNTPKTLILGSFNPFNPFNKENTDYYYGRNTNHFWKSIARNLKLEEDYFLNNLSRKIETMNKFHFCFYDVVDYLEINCEDESSRDSFIKDNIYTNFYDSVVFKQKTRNYPIIEIKRHYNRSIIELLKSNSFKKVIHTMGNNTIDEKMKTICKEKALRESGFQGFINEIGRICESRNITFVMKSFSPSQYAINTGKTSIIELDKWIKTNVLSDYSDH
jgi:hypothetical protein